MKHLRISMKRMMALVLAIAALLPAAPALAESYKAVVMGGPLTVYAEASLSGDTVTLGAYSIVTVSATNGNVAQLKSGKRTGYAELSKLKPLSDGEALRILTSLAGELCPDSRAEITIDHPVCPGE